jgi:hypothetical protein
VRPDSPVPIHPRIGYTDEFPWSSSAAPGMSG